MARRFGKTEKKERDPFEHLREGVVRYQPVYKNQYWNLMKEVVDAVMASKVPAGLIEKVEKEHASWGAITSNKKQLAFVLEKLKTLA